MPDIKCVAILADLFVASKCHKMPPNDSWKSPSLQGMDTAQNYTKGVGLAKWGPQYDYPVADGVRTYFATQDPQQYHHDAADEITDAYKNLVHNCLSAAEFAFTPWRMSLGFQNLKIMGPSVIGQNGCLKSKVKFETMFKQYPGHAQYSSKKFYNKWRDAVAKGVDKCLSNYIDKLTVPGLPWYPAFAAFPGPFAPPMPNIPWPLISCPSPGLVDITNPTNIQNAILKEFDQKLKQDTHDKVHETIFMAIAQALSVAFLIWVSTQQITLVMGQGQVPSFSLPFTPVGPVVNGMNLPGAHLMV